MLRSHPFLSPSGFLTFLLVTMVLGSVIWWKGDVLLSPGDLTDQTSDKNKTDTFSSHADFENQCERCHAPFNAKQNDLCIGCHIGVEEQIISGSGTHANLAAEQQCRNCHPDHRGRDFNILEAAFSYYDHSLAGFSLNLHELNHDNNLISCYDCHVSGDGFIFNQSACYNCHAMDNPNFMVNHIRVAGEDCLVCHDGLDSMADFNHTELRFPLLGQHLRTKCVDCHPGLVFQDTPLECFQCHEASKSHQNRFSQECKLCHSEISWLEIHFNHAAMDQNCIHCHRVDLPQDHYGDVCEDCHNTDTWEDAFFDHAGHNQCQSCHQGDAAVGHYPGQCSLCHNTETWKDIVFEHTDQTDCQSCHTNDTPQNHYPGQCSQCHVFENWGKISFNHAGFFDCITCHIDDRPSDHDDGQCSQCHNTIDWDDAEDDFEDSDDSDDD